MVTGEQAAPSEILRHTLRCVGVCAYYQQVWPLLQSAFCTRSPVKFDISLYTGSISFSVRTFDIGWPKMESLVSDSDEPRCSVPLCADTVTQTNCALIWEPNVLLQPLAGSTVPALP